MDDTLQELENELKRLTPRRLTPGLLQALEHKLECEPVVKAVPYSTPEANLLTKYWVAWSVVAVAAAIALLAVVQPSHHPAKAPAPEIASVPHAGTGQLPAAVVNQYQPVQATAVLYDLKEEGATLLPDQTEGRQVRYRYVDTYTWKNPVTKSSLRWSVPRDEVRLVRASLD